MPRLKNRLHERFAWLTAEGMDRKAAYAKSVRWSLTLRRWAASYTDDQR